MHVQPLPRYPDACHLWLTAVALAGVYFAYSATVEEHYLTEQFPDTYPVYKRSTKMLLPFIF